MKKYAEGTSISPARSRVEIEDLLKRYGASYGGHAVGEAFESIVFRIQELPIRMDVMHPDPAAPDMVRTETGLRRDRDAIARAVEKEIWRRWRVLVYLLKAKLIQCAQIEDVKGRRTTVAEEFLAHVMLPDRSTVGDRLVPDIQTIVTQGCTSTALVVSDRGEVSR